ncbi:DUF1552 domain-containing protein [Rubritalea sp.]|uniref:DUF1552 domain-containing protein n=1 Tax=Rubritalea sp. TaxID=2109375 RepID=UPI003EF920E5
MNLSSLDRRKFLRGTGIALALPWLETFAASLPKAAETKKRLACFYMPDGVPMPLSADPAFQDWSWFPHKDGDSHTFTKCLEPLNPLKQDVTVISGLSHPSARIIHGHKNADIFLTGAELFEGERFLDRVSIDQLFAEKVGDETRHSSLVLGTDGGIGSPGRALTMSYNKSGRAIPSENKPKRIFDQLFVVNNQKAARQLAAQQSALDYLLEDSRSLRRKLSKFDQDTLEQYLQSVRETEVRIEKAKRWLDIPLPSVNVDHLKLDITPEDPKNYLRAMFELIYLAFRTDSTRTVTYQIGQENGKGISDRLGRAVGFNLTHMLSHHVKKPGGWANFGAYNRFLMEEFGHFLNLLRSTPEPEGQGNMLENTLCLYGSASSAFHLSRNYPLILAGGQGMGIRQGQYLQYGVNDFDQISGQSQDSLRRSNLELNEEPMGRLLLTMLQQLGVGTKEFAGCQSALPEILA